MIFFDVTKMQGARQQSGLTRVSRRLQEELGEAAQPVKWSEGRFVLLSGQAAPLQASDWLLTVELFNADERPGFAAFVERRPCRLAAMFHDAIPVRFPHITWPHSVQRHPGYMKLLAGCDRVLAISRASRDDLAGFWRWQRVTPRASLSVVELGADFRNTPRAAEPVAEAGRALFLCVGIVEPRKNQDFLRRVGEALWAAGKDFELHVVGRINPHFGQPIWTALRETARREPRLVLHEAPDDAVLAGLYWRARAVVFPTIAEGCGLPVLESLWAGKPCLCSDLPVLRENTDAGGCLLATVNDAADWQRQVTSLLEDAELVARLRKEARTRPLPRWEDTAKAVRTELGG